MSFTFYPTFSVEDLRPYMPDVPVLLPASSWSRKGLATPRLPAHIASRTTDKGADCGGFVATRIWGDYRYTPAQYADWLSRWSPTWAATMDYCCESPITGGRASVVYDRQARTTEMAHYFWTTYRSAPWCWVPTIQGWDPDDYRKHALELRPLLEEMAQHYGPSAPWRVGVGTLCARANIKTINAVLLAVRSILPDIPLHLWGLKLKAIESIDLSHVVSSDSAAWHGQWFDGRGRTTEAARLQGISKRRYLLTVQLPAYIARVQAATLRTPALSSRTDLSPLRSLLHASGWTLRIRARARQEYVYAARRLSGVVHEYYLSSLADALSLSPATLLAKLPAVGQSESSSLTPSLWGNALPPLGNPASSCPCPTIAPTSTCIEEVPSRSSGNTSYVPMEVSYE